MLVNQWMPYQYTVSCLLLLLCHCIYGSEAVQEVCCCVSDNMSSSVPCFHNTQQPTRVNRWGVAPALHCVCFKAAQSCCRVCFVPIGCLWLLRWTATAARRF